MSRPATPILGRLALLGLLLLVALVVAVAVGAVPLSPAQVLRALAGQAADITGVIVLELRLPRALAAVLIGAALAVAGAVFQALLRNPLAEPYILGVSGGAAVAAVAVIAFAGGVAGWLVPLAAFAGAIGAIALVFRIATAAGRALDTRVLLLAGVVVGAFFNAVIMLLLTLADVETFRSAVFWMMGSLAGSTWGTVTLLAGFTLPALLLLLALARPLNLMAIGEETALYLGTPVERVKRFAYLVASLLVAAGVAAAGVIGFVGLIVPHALRLVWGADHRFLLPGAALAGAAFLLLADTAARTVAAPMELPVGVVTALVGVPVFLLLLTRSTSTSTSTSTSAGGHPPREASGSSQSKSKSNPTAAILAADALTFRYPGAAFDALAGIDLEVERGSFYAVIGPNGCGKTTLLRHLVGALEPGHGTVEFDGRPMGDWPRRDLARRVGVVPQVESLVFPIAVRELVGMGRYPHLGTWRGEGAADRAAVGRAMDTCDIGGLANRPVSTLSGGEQQRARVARALAQEPDTLVLDEPTASLDISHEMGIFELLRDLADRGVTVLIVTHNLNIAARYADRLLLLDRGRRVAEGTADAVLTAATLEGVYRWPLIVTRLGGGGPDARAPQVLPLRVDPPGTPTETRP